jgi:replicative DNA helicase Mcm
VEVQDAERAIRLTTHVLDKVSRDRETGKLDIDIVATGRPKSQVDKINHVLSLAAKIQAQLGVVDMGRLVAQAVDENVGDEIAVRRIVDDLIFKGELYKVKPGFVKIVNEVG